LSIQAHRAGTTVTAATPKANTFAIELLAQNIKKRRLLCHFHSFPFAVDQYFGQVIKPDR
jgi:hypothetical protein